MLININIYTGKRCTYTYAYIANTIGNLVDSFSVISLCCLIFCSPLLSAYHSRSTGSTSVPYKLNIYEKRSTRPDTLLRALLFRKFVFALGRELACGRDRRNGNATKLRNLRNVFLSMKAPSSPLVPYHPLYLIIRSMFGEF